MSGLGADARAVLEAWVAPSLQQEQLRSAYVDLLRAEPDAVFRTCRPDHLTASALVVSADRSRVLLTLHRKAHRWFQFGGHLEPGDPTLAAAALREASEESGVVGLNEPEGPVHLDRHAVPFCGRDGETHHLDVRYLLVAPDGADHAVSDESLDVRWWPVDGLPTDEPSILELVARTCL